MVQHTFLVPQGFDLDALIGSSPPAITNFQREKVLYIVDAISQIPARNKDVGDDRGYVPLNAEILRENIGDRYHEYLKWLIGCGVLECNGHFSVTHSISRKYRFTDAYNAPLTPYKAAISRWMERKVRTYATTGAGGAGGVTGGLTGWERPIQMLHTSPLYAKLPARNAMLNSKEQQQYHEWMRGAYPAVFRWYDEGGLQIDESLANYYNDAVWRFRTDGYAPIERRWNGKKGAWLTKDPYSQQRSNSYNVLDMQRRTYNAHFDPNVMRLHSTITSMNKEFRPAVSWRGRPLVTVDISNSQPYLLAALLNPDFWANDGMAKSVVTLYDLPYHSNYSHTYPTTDIITLCNFLQSTQPSDMVTFKEIVTSGKFYEQLAKLLPPPAGRVVYTRDEMKRLMFTVLFSSNEAINQGWATHKRAFAKLFPSVNALIRLIQANGNEGLPCLLQRLESHLVFSLILPRIEAELPDTPVFTIHDGVITLKGHERTVARIMREELYYATNNRPSYKYDYWDAGSMQHDLYWDEAMYDEWRSHMMDMHPYGL